MPRSAVAVIAVVAGLATSAVLFQLAAAMQFVAVHGIPLGASPGAPTPRYLGLLLLLAALACAVGGFVTRRIAGVRWPVLALACVAALVALVGFSGPASRWPGWWPPAIAVAALAGALAGGTRRAG